MGICTAKLKNNLFEGNFSKEYEKLAVKIDEIMFFQTIRPIREKMK